MPKLSICQRPPFQSADRWRFAACRLTLILLFSITVAPTRADDGYDLWLGYRAISPAYQDELGKAVTGVLAPPGLGSLGLSAQAELHRGLAGLLDRDIPRLQRLADGAVLVGTPDQLATIAEIGLPMSPLGDEGYLLKSIQLDGHPVVVITGNTEAALIYGVFEFLRHLQTGSDPRRINEVNAPKLKLRLLNHWDNLDGTVERGYAGRSIWDWWRLPERLDARYTDYARANASIGINGAVLNNVNASSEILDRRHLEKAAAIAGVLRPWNMRVYLSVRFSAPVELGKLPTADPLDDDVQTWWNQKAAEIYSLIPDFGGFLVKANSEGQPGPHDYGRSHAEGANTLASALEPHGGVVMWRAFVYSQHNEEDRVKQAFNEFKPLDGAFASNVLLQVKNGPLDFQPREPFHPLFGAMPKTPLMMEFQITQEYLGFSTHLVFLGTLWEEVLQADTLAHGPGTRVAQVLSEGTQGGTLTGMAGVANTGSDRNWSGSIFAQANWYAFGRLAWNPGRHSPELAREWLKLTFTTDPDFVEPATTLMLRSREAAVRYMTPLGLAHLMGTGHHYGPAPWVSDLERPEWNPTYYHRADADGIGFDRTEKGSNAVAQYAAPLARQLGNPATVPQGLLLWFHRLPWDFPMPSGATLWQELVAHYDQGVADVQSMRSTWSSLEQHVDPERFEQTAQLLDIQLREALWWRDACLAYFSEVSGKAMPVGARPPAANLQHYKNLEFPHAPGQ